jgi:hypothetical protein
VTLDLGGEIDSSEWKSIEEIQIVTNFDEKIQ